MLSPNTGMQPGVGHGLGKNIWDLDLLTTLDRVKECIQILFLCQCLHAAALMLVKLSIISTYRRLFPTNRMHYTLAVLALVITSVAIATLFGTLFQCRPVAAAWDFSIERSQCMPVAPLYYFSTSFSAATDVLLCLLPLPFFWKLQVSLREKIIVSSLFGLGLIAAAASVMRLTQLSILQDVNVTMRATPALGWSVGEVIIGIVCACLPCLKPLFNKHLPGTFFTHVHGTKTTTATATTISGTYPIQGPRLQKYPSQALAHLSTSGSGLWRGRGQSWYQRPTLTTVGSWRDGLEETTTTTTTRNKETV